MIRRNFQIIVAIAILVGALIYIVTDIPNQTLDGVLNDAADTGYWLVPTHSLIEKLERKELVAGRPTKFAKLDEENYFVRLSLDSVRTDLPNEEFDVDLPRFVDASTIYKEQEVYRRDSGASARAEMSVAELEGYFFSEVPAPISFELVTTDLSNPLYAGMRNIVVIMNYE